MGFFERLFGKKNSAENAKERLQLVLIHDRTDLTPAELDSLKDDLITTISRHVEIDAQGRATRTLNHLLKIFLVDAQRQVREVYSVATLAPVAIVNDLHTLRIEADARPHGRG